MDPMIVAAFVAFFALLAGCLVAPTGTPAPVNTAARPGAAAAD